MRTTQYQQTKSPTRISSNCGVEKRVGGRERGREGGREGGEEEDSKGEGKVCWQLARWRSGGRVEEGARTACRVSL